MNILEAQTSVKNVTSESFLLNPSSLITLFQVDVSDLGFNIGLISESAKQSQKNTVFRFHNNINLTRNSIFWRNEEYIAAPIQATDFEFNIKGNANIPKLTMTVSDEGIPLLSIFKQRLMEFGDIVGAKVIRIRTYARFLDAVNFIDNIPPNNFYPDPNAELPRDIYYIDRKSVENKNFIQYELASLFELDGIQLPGRLVTANNCTFLYRGGGCLYENANRISSIHEDGDLPENAPPVATIFNEKISDLIGNTTFNDKGEYNYGGTYEQGDYVYIQVKGIKYYYVSKTNNNRIAPPDSSYWIADQCSKTLLGCRLRWNNISDSSLPFGGYPSCDKFK